MPAPVLPAHLPAGGMVGTSTSGRCHGGPAPLAQQPLLLRPPAPAPCQARCRGQAGGAPQRPWRASAALHGLPAFSSGGPQGHAGGRARHDQATSPPSWAARLARATLLASAAQFCAAASQHAASAANVGGGWGGNGAGGSGGGGGGGGDGGGPSSASGGHPGSANVLADVAEASGEQLVEEVVLLDVGGELMRNGNAGGFGG